MAAGVWLRLLRGSNEKIEHAAEIAMEHHLGIEKFLCSAIACLFRFGTLC